MGVTYKPKKGRSSMCVACDHHSSAVSSGPHGDGQGLGQGLGLGDAGGSHHADQDADQQSQRSPTCCCGGRRRPGPAKAANDESPRSESRWGPRWSNPFHREKKRRGRADSYQPILTAEQSVRSCVAA